MGAALGHHLTPLASHQVPQLVDEEGGREGGDAASWDGDQLSTHRAPDSRQSRNAGCHHLKELHKGSNDSIDHL